MRLPVVVVAAALAVPLAGCGNGTTPTTGGTPPPLLLAGAGAADLAANAGAGTKGNDGWRLAGTLPSGIPEAERIRELSRGPVDRDKVIRLVNVLGLGSPHRRGASWVVGTTLSVRDDTGQPWSYGKDVAVCSPPAAADERVGCISVGGVATADSGAGSGGGSGTSGSSGSSSGSTGTASKSATTSTVAPGSKPTTTIPSATAERVATAVFEATGIGDASTTVTPGDAGVAYVAADPVVSGLPTSGFTTSVMVGSNSRVIAGNGWLGTVTDGPAYPLISARAAFDQLKAQPRPLAAAMPCQINKPCPGSTPQVVTGARLGLSLQYRDNSRPVLVPSWLFDIAGVDQPVAQIAVEPRFLVRPTPAATPPTGKPGSTDPGPPTATVPNPRPSSYTASADGRTLTVEYAVGVCPQAEYAASAKESEQSITVIVRAHDIQPMDPNTACIELAQIKHATVKLQAPIGERTVTDEDGNEVQNLND